MLLIGCGMRAVRILAPLRPLRPALTFRAAATRCRDADVEGGPDEASTRCHAPRRGGACPLVDGGGQDDEVETLPEATACAGSISGRVELAVCATVFF